MKPTARVATVFILLFFIFFNGLQAYLIFERISEAKNKLRRNCSAALFNALNDYTKLKGIDSASLPDNAWIVYSQKNIQVNRVDSQRVNFTTPSSSLVTDSVLPAIVEIIVNGPGFKTVDMHVFDSIFRKTLLLNQVHSEYHIDTINFPVRKSGRGQVEAIWQRKKRKEYFFSTGPSRVPFYSNVFIFADVKSDPDFLKKDLLWPMLSFAFILLISNTALVFVYKTIRKQKRINELKTDFINNITHEMKTPITIASAGLDAMEHHVAPTERTSFYLHTSKKQLHLLNEFVERILESAVQDISDFTLKKEKIDVYHLFEELVPGYSILKGKPINFKLAGKGPVYINGDRLHLETAFHNIIDNAIKYSGDSVDINIDIGENSRDCTIKIRDNGMGIPAQFIKNVFEKFFRVPQGDAQSVKGFGLGLYYVSNIIKKHSGNISMQSKGQSGTEFIISLPKYT